MIPNPSFSRESKKNEEQKAASSSVYVRRNDLDKIVEEETKRRHSMAAFSL